MDDGELADLVRRAQAGDAAALDAVLAHVRPLVMRRCSKFLPYTADAEEAAQDALLAIAQKIHTYSGKGSFAGWVTVVASNCARQTYRTLRRRFDEHGVDDLPDEPDPRTTSVIAGTRLDLLDALEQLERDHPAVVQSFVLRDLGALPYDEVAALTEVPVGTTKARIHTARRYLRERLDNLSGDSGI